MRKIFAIFILFLISTSYAYCQDFNGKVDLSEDERAWLQENPVLKAPNQPTWAPIDFVVDGKPQGFSIDFLNLIAKNVGFEVEYVSDRNWSELLKALESEEIDIALSIIETTERKEYLNFTDPYLDMTVVYYGKTGSKKNNNINDLRSLRIGDVAGGVAATIYKNQYPELNIIEYGTSYDVLMAIVNDEIDVMPAINTVANYLIDINNIDDVIIIGDTFFPLTGIEGNINFAAIKKHPLLHSILVKGMASVSEKELYDLKVKWRMLPFLDENVVLTEEEKEWLTSNNEIVVASDITKEPIEFLDANGELSGYSADYLNLIAKRLGVTFEWSGSKNWQEAIEKINEKEADIVSFIMPTEDRKDTFTFTDIYHDVAHMVIARSENSMFGSLEALEGKTVAQVRNYAITNFIESDFPSVNIIYTSSISESLELVSSGEADAYVGTVPLAVHSINVGEYNNLVIVGDTPYRARSAMGIRSDLPLLASAIQKAMRSITSIEKAEVSRKWSTINVETKVDYTLVWQVMVVASIIVGIILVWNNKLRMEVSRRRNAEASLVVARQRVERALSDSERANTAKSTFLANMSHEIRTPLNAIIGFSSVMESGIFGQIKEKKYIEYLKDIKESGKHLETVIDDILDISKIEANKWHLDEKEFDLEYCINASRKMIAQQAFDKEIKITCNLEKDIQVFGDETCIKRILINILSNSVKFTAAAGAIKIKTRIDQNKCLIISISDNGVGIAKNKLESVMLPFGQDEQVRDINKSGTGLGLAIVKELIELHGGSITLTSEEDVGTLVTLMLPSDRVII